MRQSKLQTRGLRGERRRRAKMTGVDSESGGVEQVSEVRRGLH